MAGKQRGMAKGSGTRSGLLWEVERLLNEVENLPQMLLMENVPQVHGEANMPHFIDWIDFLKSKGYSSYWQDLNAKNYGVAQNRDRCFMISILGDWNYKFPQPIPLTKTIKDYLEDEVDDRYYISNSKADALIQKLIDNGTLNGRKTELWLPVKGYEEYYEVSNYGNVRALQREVSTSDGKIRKLGYMDLKPIMNKTGYFTVNLCKDGEHKIHYIHRLVADCFVENPLCKDTVNHKDGNKTNNYFENLEWLTMGENMEHAWRTGLCHSSNMTGGVKSVAKLDAETGAVLEVYPSIAEASRINKHASASGISGVLSGQKITSHGFKWEYVDKLLADGTIPQSRAEQSRAEQSISDLR